MLGQIAENFPSSSYAAVPKGLFNYGGGGVNGWRNLCGVPNGGAAMLKIVTGSGTVIDEYVRWYEKTAFPTNAAYEDHADGGWTAVDAVAPKDSAPMAVPKSLLCHASHGRWLEAAGGADGAWVTEVFGGNATAAGSDRCAKMVYDCVYKCAELVNDFMAGTFTAVETLDPSVDACLTSGCHAGAVDGPIGDCAPHVQGKMKCDESCHQ